MLAGLQQSPVPILLLSLIFTAFVTWMLVLNLRGKLSSGRFFAAGATGLGLGLAGLWLVSGGQYRPSAVLPVTILELACLYGFGRWTASRQEPPGN